MSKRCLAVVALGVALLAAPFAIAEAAFVDLEAGSLTSGVGIFATDGWGSGQFRFSWDINVDTSGSFNVYQYIYTIDNPLDVTDPRGELLRQLSHLLLQLSDNFTAANFLDGTTGLAEGPKLYAAQGCEDPGSNACLPVDLFGAKFLDSPTGNGPYTFTIITDREPMDGSFYANDGNCNTTFPCTEGKVFAYNTGLTNSEGAFIRVPDTETVTTREIVPSPAALLLLGSGLFTAGLAGRVLGRLRRR
jgi:hypothetical protein